ncbi:MAG: Asp-tRNA(Asn)/Glu-tRNA(Gln) amidotransferase subunit GatC [Anaerolineae bacterium]|nr:Asp-tRNA(Asn)/Glu-tRNA(Gln) amidotransferase subunit GatC [Anaerolineae bacterium]
MTQRIDEEQVRHIAFLTRLAVDDAEVAAFSEQMSTIIDYFDLLGEVNIEGVAPASQPPIGRDLLRPDVIKPSLPREDFLANAPARQDAYVRVPVVIDTPEDN